MEPARILAEAYQKQYERAIEHLQEARVALWPLPPDLYDDDDEKTDPTITVPDFIYIVDTSITPRAEAWKTEIDGTVWTFPVHRFTIRIPLFVSVREVTLIVVWDPHRNTLRLNQHGYEIYIDRILDIVQKHTHRVRDQAWHTDRTEHTITQ